MTASEWKTAIKSLPNGLTPMEVAKKLNQPYNVTRSWLIKNNYKGRNGYKARRQDLIARYSVLDWSQSNQTLALQTGTSREYMRQVREIFGYKKVEARGAKPRPILLA